MYVYESESGAKNQQKLKTANCEYFAIFLVEFHFYPLEFIMKNTLLKKIKRRNYIFLDCISDGFFKVEEFFLKNLVF